MLTRLPRTFTRRIATSSVLYKAVKPVSPAIVDIRVGQITKCTLHPEADRLFVSQVHSSGTEPFSVISALRNHVPIESMQGRRVVMVTNLKSAKMRGIQSNGMLLCAERLDGMNLTVDLIHPPQSAQPGDRLVFQSFEEEPANRVNSNNWTKIMGGLFTDNQGRVGYRDPEGSEHLLVLKGGEEPATSTITNAMVL